MAATAANDTGLDYKRILRFVNDAVGSRNTNKVDRLLKKVPPPQSSMLQTDEGAKRVIAQSKKFNVGDVNTVVNILPREDHSERNIVFGLLIWRLIEDRLHSTNKHEKHLDHLKEYYKKNALPLNDDRVKNVENELKAATGGNVETASASDFNWSDANKVRIVVLVAGDDKRERTSAAARALHDSDNSALRNAGGDPLEFRSVGDGSAARYGWGFREVGAKGTRLVFEVQVLEDSLEDSPNAFFEYVRSQPRRYEKMFILFPDDDDKSEFASNVKDAVPLYVSLLADDDAVHQAVAEIIKTL